MTNTPRPASISKRTSATAAPAIAWSWDGRSSPSTTASACAACTASTSCPRRCGPARNGAPPSSSVPKPPSCRARCFPPCWFPSFPKTELIDTLQELIKRIWEFWDEYGKNRERVGELIQRVGMANFLDAIGLDPTPEMVTAPRDNPYIYFQIEKGG